MYRFYRQLLRPDHPLATAVAADMKSFKGATFTKPGEKVSFLIDGHLVWLRLAAREAGGLSRTELWHSFREQRLSVQWDEQIIGRIVGFSQSGRSTELPIKVPLLPFRYVDRPYMQQTALALTTAHSANRHRVARYCVLGVGHYS